MNRTSARVLVLDGRDRLLLFRSYLNTKDPAAGFCWLTPGGGVSDGESLPVAAARELREETGLVVPSADLGPVVAFTDGYADLGVVEGWFHDLFFCYRTDRHEVDTSGFEELERSQITGHRWWSPAELASTVETVFPYGLVALLEDLLAGSVPAEPVRLPWHH